MHFLLTCNSGLESVIKKEIQSLGYIITNVSDKLVYFTGDESAIARVNLWSRAGNKLYILLAKGPAGNFDSLFEQVYSIDRKEYVGNEQGINVLAHTIKSQLTSIPAIQSIAKKSIIKKLLGGEEGFWYESRDFNPLEVLVTIEGDIAHVLLNTTGRSLHQRGYRTHTYEAPIKENLAAGIISLATWKYSSPFYDFFCGSGTMVIEAAMIAKNIAPGLNRNFSFDDFAWFDDSIFQTAKTEAKDKMMTAKQHTIIGYDINPQAIKIAQTHAKNAGVDEFVVFEERDFLEIDKSQMQDLTFVSNPPYGLRLQGEEEILHRNIAKFFEDGKNIQGGIITAYEQFGNMIFVDDWKLRKLYNGGEKSYFYKFLGEK